MIGEGHFKPRKSMSNARVSIERVQARDRRGSDERQDNLKCPETLQILREIKLVVISQNFIKVHRF